MQALPLPARLVPWPKAPPTTLARCLWLALLLHLWLVMWLGNAPGGTARQGQGVWGAVNVTLRGPVSEGSANLPPPPVPSNDTSGAGAVPRWGGAVRQTQALPDSQPGAAQLGVAAARDSATPAQRVGPVSAAAVAPELPAPAATARIAPVDPALQERAPVSVAPLAPTPSEAVPTLAAVPTLPAPAAPVTTAPPPSAEPPAPADRRLATMAPGESPSASLARTAAQTLPVPAALPDLPPAVAVITAPQPLATMASPLQQTPAAAVPIAPLPPMPSSTPLPSLAAPAELAAAPLGRLQAAPAPARTAEPALSRSTELPAVALPRAAAVGPAPSAGPAGALDAGERVGHDVATPAAAAASAVPRLNLQLTRPRGGELSRYSTAGVLPVLPRPPELDDKLARDIEKSGKSDCRNAYSTMGPLAVIPLAVDALRKEGACKW